jgi:hypothetical protein
MNFLMCVVIASASIGKLVKVRASVWEYRMLTDESAERDDSLSHQNRHTLKSHALEAALEELGIF